MRDRYRFFIPSFLPEHINIELLVPRGPDFGHFKSDELYEKMLKILGFKTDEEYGRAQT